MSNEQDPYDSPDRPKSALHTAAWQKPLIVGVSALITAGIIGGGAWWWMSREPEPMPMLPVPAIAPPAPAPEPPSEPLPPKELLDGEARQVLSQLCSAPGAASWLATDDILRRIAIAVENVAQGDSPAEALSMLAPEGKVAVRDNHGRLFIDPKSFARYNRVADAIGALDATSCARAYSQVKPILERVYREVGPRGRTFEQALTLAVKRLTSVPVPRGPLEVLPHVTYRYADSALEGRSRAEKHLLRLGPRNMQIVQKKLQELVLAIHAGNPQ